MSHLGRLSDKRLWYTYCQVVNRMRRDLSDGSGFGIDWPTLRISYPAWYRDIQRVRSEIQRRIDDGTWIYS